MFNAIMLYQYGKHCADWAILVGQVLATVWWIRTCRRNSGTAQ